MGVQVFHFILVLLPAGCTAVMTFSTLLHQALMHSLPGHYFFLAAHRRRAVHCHHHSHTAVMPSITVAVTPFIVAVTVELQTCLPSPSPPRHPLPLLPLLSPPRRPLPSRLPLPLPLPMLHHHRAFCCRRVAIARSIVVAVALPLHHPLPSRHPSPLPPHCRHTPLPLPLLAPSIAVAIAAVVSPLSHLLLLSHRHHAVHRRCSCVVIAPSITVAIVPSITVAIALPSHAFAAPVAS